MNTEILVIILVLGIVGLLIYTDDSSNSSEEGFYGYGYGYRNPYYGGGYYHPYFYSGCNETMFGNVSCNRPSFFY